MRTLREFQERRNAELDNELEKFGGRLSQCAGKTDKNATFLARLQQVEKENEKQRENDRKHVDEMDKKLENSGTSKHYLRNSVLPNFLPFLINVFIYAYV